MSIQKGCPMSFPANYSKKYVQNVKILSLCLYSFMKMVWFNLALQQYKVQPVPPTEQSTGFKVVVPTPKLGMGIPLHTKFWLTKYFKSSHYRRKTQ